MDYADAAEKEAGESVGTAAGGANFFHASSGFSR
jgi:hypothetical protein